MVFPTEKSTDVVGVGNALMDLLVEVDEQFLSDNGLGKGGMYLVDEDVARGYLERLSDHHIRTEAGGAAANATRGVAFLGGKVSFYGMVGDDIYGGMYRDSLRELSVSSVIGTDGLHTGHAVTYITPDSERTFSVYLGAALTLKPEHIKEEDIATAKILHIEAFQIEGSTQETVFHAIGLAKKHGTKVSLDLADAGLIKRNFDLFQQIVSEDVDIVFANETEGIAFTGTDGEDALRTLSTLSDIAILKLGERGSLISCSGEIHRIDPVLAEAVDTTGAGDMYAAGFLYGLTHGFDIQKAGELGSALAAEIVAQIGVGLDTIKNPLKTQK